MSVQECREHHWGSDGRCRYCNMQARYFAECMATLNRWSDAEKADPNEHWQEKVDNLKCNPHSHEENPILKLYDIEGTK